MKKRIIITIAALAALSAGCGTAITKTVDVTKTVTVPGPTITETVHVPGPVKTVIKTVTVQAPPPATGQTIGTWSGSGNQVTPAFNAPASGDYIVYWTYSNNAGANFIISTTDQGATGLGLPNDIGSSGSGSTEVQGASGTESFNVEATGGGNWTIKVVVAA